MECLRSSTLAASCEHLRDDVKGVLRHEDFNLGHLSQRSGGQHRQMGRRAHRIQRRNMRFTVLFVFYKCTNKVNMVMQ